MHFKTFILVFLTAPIASLAQDPVGYFIHQEGDSVLIYPSPDGGGAVTLGSQTISYYQRGAKNPKYENQKNIAEFHYGGRKLVNLPISSLGMDRLQEVIIQNDRYLMTSYFSTNQYLYVYDLTTMEVLVKKEKHSYGEKRDRELMTNVVTKYFKDCPEAIAAMEKGLEEAYEKTYWKSSRHLRGNPRLFAFVSNHTCGKE